MKPTTIRMHFSVIFSSRNFLLLFLSLLVFNTHAQTVTTWLTNSNQSALLQQGSTSFATGGSATISVNSGTTYQTMDGFGFTLTEGSAEAIASLSTAQQNNLLNEVFSPSSGIGVSVLRISLGASDLSSSSYTYNDNGPDPNLNNFSLNGPDMTYLIPLIKRIQVLNPNVKILATPWSAPRWMKTNNAWVGGSLQGGYYGTYANYFVKYLAAMRGQGIEIWAVTPQNEPENPWNEPSMTMNASEQLNFIHNHLGPAIRNAGYGTKIIAFDHNCDNTAYPIQVLNGSSYVDGAGFHLYAGNISAMSDVKNATGKNVYFTEQFTSSNGNFAGDFPWHMQNVMIGSTNNWAKIALEWNLATNASFGPRTPGGCTECLGGITIHNSSSYTKNVSYYIVGQMSKFVKAGAVRIQSSTSDNTLNNVAFRNPDGSIVVVVFNAAGAKTFTVGFNGKTFSYNIPGWSASTFVWSNGVPPSTDVVTTFKDCNYGGFSGGLAVGDYTLAQLNALGIMDDDISSLRIAQGYKAILYADNNFTGQSLELTSDMGCLSSLNDLVTSIRIRTNGVTNLAGTYYLQNKNSGLNLDVAGGTSATADGANIHQWESNGGQDNQKFEFIHLGEGTYRINAKHSGKSLDVDGIKKENGANVQQWTYYGSHNQQFIAVDAGGGFHKLIAKHSGRIVEVANAGIQNGNNVQQWDNNNQTCGQWKLVPTTVANGNGDGLLANYFNGMNFETPMLSRKETTINLNWNGGSPAAGVNADLFSARYTGQIQPRYSGLYTFYINSDNGRRLWINNQLIIDKWIDDLPEYTGTINLTAGVKYDIRIDYFENVGGANIKLEWSSPNQTREVVPQSQLYSNSAPTISIASPANGASYTAPATIDFTSTASDNGSVAKVEYFNGNTKIGESASSPYFLSWKNVGEGNYTIKAVATDNLGAVTVSSAISVSVKKSSIGNGDGLTANYFNGMNFETPVLSRKDANVNFNWGQGSPAAGVNADQYSVRWTGQIQPIHSETYTFYINSDNGRRVWVNDQLLIDKWIDNWNIEYTGTINLIAGQKYNIRVDYFENNGGADIKLEWSSATQLRQIIPQTQLYSNPLPSVSITAPANNASFSAPANINITANLSDNSSISKVEFFNGASKLGEDNTAPYSIAWNNVGTGTYSLTARAFDNLSAINVSSGVTLQVTTVTQNQAPLVSITGPANNSNYNAPASITFTADAADNDGTIGTVEFFNGATSIGSDNIAPYSISWNNVAAGTYTITAKATDNANATTTSSAITVKVNTVSTGCALPQYAENNGYVPGSKVKNAGRQYECKEYPYSGWCNGAAWAYAPGTGAYWADAWYDRGSCAARVETSSYGVSFVQEVLISPNPTNDEITIHLDNNSVVSVLNAQGKMVVSSTELESNGTLSLRELPSGIYLIRIETDGATINKMVVKQ